MFVIFGHIEKQLDYNDMADFKIYNVTTWETNDCNTHFA